MSSEQAKQIIEYRTQNGAIVSIYELKHIGFSPTLLEVLNPYFKTDIKKEHEANIIYVLRAQSKFKNEENYLLYLNKPIEPITAIKVAKTKKIFYHNCRVSHVF